MLGKQPVGEAHPREKNSSEWEIQEREMSTLSTSSEAKSLFKERSGSDFTPSTVDIPSKYDVILVHQGLS